MEGTSVAGIALPEGDPGAVRDAARQLRSVGGGFDGVATTVNAAVAAVPGWYGQASLLFSERCTDFRGAATLADGACEDAARVLDGYADDLAAARKKVRTMQEEGERLETEEKKALQDAEDARGRLRGAQVSMKLAALDAPMDGGTALEGLRQQAMTASEDVGRAVDRANAARIRLDELIGKARDVREQVERQGIAAAKSVRGAADQLPGVIGAPTGGIGGTPLGSHSTKFEGGITIIVFHLGGSKAVIKERTADGKYRVTVIDGVEGGLEFDPVPGAGVDGGKAGRLGAGADVQAAFLAQYKNGETYEFRDEELADRFIFYEDKYVPDSADQLMRPGSYPSPEFLSGFAIAKTHDRWQDRQRPVERFSEGGLKARGDVSLQGAAGGSAAAEKVLGRKVDTKTGVSTTYTRTSAEVAGQVGYTFEAGGKFKGEGITSISRDSSDRLTSYSVTLSGSAEGHSGISGAGESKKVSGGFSHHETTGVRMERQMTLDLNDPTNREIVEDHLRSGGTDPVANARLVERLANDARVDVRVYDTGATQSGANIDVKIVKIDGSSVTEDAKLRSLEHSNPGGPRIETVK